VSWSSSSLSSYFLFVLVVLKEGESLVDLVGGEDTSLVIQQGHDLQIQRPVSRPASGCVLLLRLRVRPVGSQQEPQLQ
jgi:hypothetical protein